VPREIQSLQELSISIKRNTEFYIPKIDFPVMHFTEQSIFFLVGKPEGKTPLGRPRRKWVDNIKMDLREIG
jgi:hypothetical protein